VLPRTGMGVENRLSGVAPHLPEQLREQVLGEALAVAPDLLRQERLCNGDRTEAESGLSPYPPEPLKGDALREALATARAIRDAEDQVRTLLGLASHLPESLRGEFLMEAQMIEPTSWTEDEVGLADILVRLGLNQPETLTGNVLREALIKTRTVQGTDERTRVLTGLAPRLANLPPATLYPLWCETLHLLATRTREDLLADLCTLVPVIAALAGTLQSFHGLRQFHPPDVGVSHCSTPTDGVKTL